MFSFDSFVYNNTHKKRGEKTHTRTNTEKTNRSSVFSKSLEWFFRNEDRNIYKPDRPQTTNANEKEKQLKIAPHATSTKNGSPSATCATTFCAACEASGEMTVAAMRAVVAMAVCLISFVVHGIV
ncbi:unnamed protein product [Bathycoccus prasinos]